MINITLTKKVDIFFKYVEKLLIKNHVLVKIYLLVNKKMTLNEIKMGNSLDNCKFLCIGCGAIPWTLILLAKVKHWEFTGIDKDQNAVNSAKKLIDYFDLSDKITIKNVNALDYNISDFDLILIAFGVHPRKKLLKKLSLSLKDNGKILYRTTWAGLDKLYGKDSIPQTFNIKNVYHRIDGIKSLLLVNRNLKG